MSQSSTTSNASLNSMRSVTVNDVVEVMDHVVVGAGVCGLVAAKELAEGKKKYVVLEKTHDVMGCWRQAANSSSHVAVCEPAYRFDYDHGDKFASDFTGRDEIYSECQNFIAQHGISEHIRYGACVTNVEKASNDLWEISYTLTTDDSTIMCTIKARGVFMALGAQQVPRVVEFRGEREFAGTISYGIKDHMPLEQYKGAKVVIVGSGAFATENLRTALLNGAKHVTLVYRTAIQCWPRLLHYHATMGNTTLGKLGEPYNVAVKWAGLEGKVEPFMSKGCTAQPTASDIFYLAYKTGRLDLKKSEIEEVQHHSVRTKHGDILECDVLLKCVGWEEPALRKVFPEFSSRRFVFLNGSSSLAFVSDPHYQHRTSSNARLHTLQDVPVKGGTFSVLTLATVSIRLQLFFMDHPEQYKKAMAQLADSNQPVCNWFQQRWDYEDLPEVNELIDNTLQRFKNQTQHKFPDASAYIAMAAECYQRDAACFMTGPVGYIFKPDGSGNFFEYSPEQVQTSDKAQGDDIQKDFVVSRPRLQEMAYKGPDGALSKI
jgi:hypothetical protein